MFVHTLRNTHEWLDEMSAILGTRDEEMVSRALRSSLHALRDSLTASDAVAFGVQLPMLIRGLYYEGWHPRTDQPSIANPSTFLSRIASEGPDGVDPERIARAACAVIAKHVEPGPWEHALHLVPGPLHRFGATRGFAAGVGERWERP